AEGQGGVEGEGLVLADEVVARGMRALDGALLHGVDRAERRHDFACAEDADLELAAGDRGNPLGNGLAAAVDRVQALRKARGAAPAHLGQRLRNRRRGDRGGCGTASGGEEFPAGGLHGNGLSSGKQRKLRETGRRVHERRMQLCLQDCQTEFDRLELLPWTAPHAWSSCSAARPTSRVRSSSTGPWCTTG